MVCVGLFSIAESVAGNSCRGTTRDRWWDDRELASGLQLMGAAAVAKLELGAQHRGHIARGTNESGAGHR